MRVLFSDDIMIKHGTHHDPEYSTGQRELLRKQLNNTNQSDLAELRLRLRDEYMRRGSVKDRLRRSSLMQPDPLHPVQGYISFFK